MIEGEGLTRQVRRRHLPGKFVDPVVKTISDAYQIFSARIFDGWATVILRSGWWWWSWWSWWCGWCGILHLEWNVCVNVSVREE